MGYYSTVTVLIHKDLPSSISPTLLECMKLHISFFSWNLGCFKIIIDKERENELGALHTLKVERQGLRRFTKLILSACQILFSLKCETDFCMYDENTLYYHVRLRVIHLLVICQGESVTTAICT